MYRKVKGRSVVLSPCMAAEVGLLIIKITSMVGLIPVLRFAK